VRLGDVIGEREIRATGIGRNPVGELKKTSFSEKVRFTGEKVKGRMKGLKLITKLKLRVFTLKE